VCNMAGEAILFSELNQACQLLELDFKIFSITMQVSDLRMGSEGSNWEL